MLESCFCLLAGCEQELSLDTQNRCAEVIIWEWHGKRKIIWEWHGKRKIIWEWHGKKKASQCRYNCEINSLPEWEVCQPFCLCLPAWDVRLLEKFNMCLV